jgi:hypothetical protein
MVKRIQDYAPSMSNNHLNPANLYGIKFYCKTKQRKYILDCLKI